VDTLRWILLILGLLVLAGIYVAGRMRAASRRPRDLVDEAVEREALEQIHIRADSGSAMPPLKPELQDDLDALNDLENLKARVVEEARERPVPPPAPAPHRQPRPAEARRTERKEETRGSAASEGAAAPSEKLIVLHVAAGPSGRILGVELKSALDEEGLEFGVMDIYHRMVPTERGRVPQFSVANMLKPGTFDPAAMDDFSTVGVSMFLQLPGPREAMESFEAMLSCAEGLATRLGGQVLDASRSTLPPQGIEHIRESIREWALKARIAGRH
jgi:cell division protein ZipA